MLVCPKCHKKLILNQKTYQCENNHCFDISKRGYINLLLNPDKNSNNPGDSKESLDARKAFLNQGYYDGILSEVLKMIRKYNPQAKEILDLGCGEGYYTSKLYEKFPANYYALDISKIGIDKATRYSKDITWIVANSKNIPIEDKSLDIITALFTVVNSEEIKRTLKDSGYMIHVTANNKHLIEFKHLIYDEVKVKSDKFIRQPFEVVESYDYQKTISLKTKEATFHLLQMTPHFYHIKKEKRSLLDHLKPMNVTIDIKITVYKL